ncbi:MAG: hypothetical protein IPK13_21460 [Deltaproteobacteria bacterium]|nr:hypothetical protein [Deltaproteobacteria bacterium]
MSESDRRIHEEWLGMVQPIDGLVFAVPVLEEAQVAVRLPPERQHALIAQCPERREAGAERRRIADLDTFFDVVLDLRPGLFDRGDALPAALSLWVPEGKQKLAPTSALRRRDRVGAAGSANPTGAAGPAGQAAPAARTEDETETPESRAGADYLMLVWELPAGLAFHRAETETGPWSYPPASKFERLLRACRVPMGLLVNGEALRFVYAPHGGSTGSITFSIDAMTAVGGRPIFDAFSTLFSGARIFHSPPEASLLGLLEESRKRQAHVTNALAEQVHRALTLLLAGFEAAGERDGRRLMGTPAQDQDQDQDQDQEVDVYGGLLCTLLRLVFMLYAEDHRDAEGRGLLPVEHPLYQKHISVHGLFDELQEDADRYPDTMDRRFGAWSRLLAAFHAVYEGAWHAEGAWHRTFLMPPRRGELFDPSRYPFLEGWDDGPPVHGKDRAETRVPSIDDGTVYQILRCLLILGEDDRKGRGQRLAYRALDVEQIGSVYEKLMGYHVLALKSPGVAVKPDAVWVTAGELLALKPGQREAYLVQEAGVPAASAKKVAAALKAARSEASMIDALRPLSVAGPDASDAFAAGRLVLQPGPERRRTSSHYTPRELTEPVVKHTLDPIVARIRARNGGAEPTSKQLLSLKICDPAMGSGAFLVAACRYLADLVVAAWTREGEAEKLGSTAEDATVMARRLVAQRCLYGVDKNPFAVGLAKLALWLATLSKDEPFTFVDHALRHGDSLVGLGLEQIEAFHWAPPADDHDQLTLFRPDVRDALAEAHKLRRAIVDLAGESGPIATRKKELLLKDADDALARAKTIADVVVGAFFAGNKDADRKKELGRRCAEVEQWLASGGEKTKAIADWQAELQRQDVPPFHWMLEFPEVFFADREEPLADTGGAGVAYMDAFIGNPPFLGGGAVSSRFGDAYRDWLLAMHPGSHGNADLSAHFFRRTDTLLGTHGTIGLLATNTIGQGDTRTTALRAFLWPPDRAYRIYRAESSKKWPGAANVSYAVVHIAKGALAKHQAGANLDGRSVSNINSRLRPKPERSDPVLLRANAELSYLGFKIYGQGFTFDDKTAEATAVAEMARLIKADRRNKQRIFPYLGGKEVNDSPTQSPHRYVISFGQMPLEEAERWPDLLAIVREKVKPERDRLRDNADGRRLKAFWWQFGRTRPELAQALAGLGRCLVTSRVTKHLLFSWQPTDRVLNEKLYVFPFEDNARMAVLQSRVHEVWVRLLSSTMRNDLNYAASDCFETFPFPATALGPTSALERLGEALDAARARIMTAHDHGLTVLYNKLKDPEEADPEIVALRALHEAVDRAVIAAYGWEASSVPVPPYASPADSPELVTFADEVLDRLFALNAERAARESAKPTPERATPTPRPARDTSARTLAATARRSGTKRAAAAKAPVVEGQTAEGKTARTPSSVAVKRAPRKTSKGRRTA